MVTVPSLISLNRHSGSGQVGHGDTVSQITLCGYRDKKKMHGNKHRYWGLIEMKLVLLKVQQCLMVLYIVLVCSLTGHAQSTSGRNLSDAEQLGDKKAGQFRSSKEPNSPSGELADVAAREFDAGKYQQSISTCDRALLLMDQEGASARCSPSYVKRTLAFCLIELGHYQDGLNILLPLMQNGWGTYWSEYAALALAHTGHAKEAIECLKGSYEMDAAQLRPIWRNIGTDAKSVELLARHRILGLMLSYSQLDTCLHQCIEEKKLDRGSPIVAMDLGETLFKLGRLQEAKVEFKLASTCKQKAVQAAASAWLEKVRYRLEIGELDKAATLPNKTRPSVP